MAESDTDTPISFKDLGLIEPLLDAVHQLSYKQPTEIQSQVIPLALEGRDVIGVAETGSGKTAAFALPILQKLWENPKPYFACILAPTRELACQISQQFEALGSGIGIRCVVVIGGDSVMDQSIALHKKPHVIVATPGRLQYHLEKTKGFNLRNLEYLVFDEADRLLDLDFGPSIDRLLKELPRERRTYLFSATMTTKVEKLQRASLSNPLRLQANNKHSTVESLLQHFLFIPLAQKEVYLVSLANSQAQSSMIIFTRTVHDCQRLALILRHLNFPAVPLNGQMNQSARLGALSKFKGGGRSILVATDVASRGLDIPHVALVINYDVPTNSKDYIHRVGRTARAGRSGKSITIVSQYDVELVQRIEAVVGKKMAEWPMNKDEVDLLRERVDEAGRIAAAELREMNNSKSNGLGRKRKRPMDIVDGADNRDRDDDVVEAGIPSRKAGRRK